MKIIVISGPNINLLGQREPDIYGTNTYQDLQKYCREIGRKYHIKFTFKQSNHEGDLIDYIQKSHFQKYDYGIINAAGYTHTSISIRDAIAAINIPYVEVHLTDIENREYYRHTSYIRDVCLKSFIGDGFESYKKAIEYIANRK